MKHVFNAGEIYSFKTSPSNKFSAPDTQRYGCLKILLPQTTLGEVKNISVVYVVLDKIFTNRPSIDDLMNSGPLVRKRFAIGQMTAFQRMSKNPPKNYASNSVRLDWEPDLLEFSLLGTLQVTEIEKEIGEKNRSFSTWGFASADAEGEWRWAHDKELLLREHALLEEDNERRVQAEKERFEKRLSKLNWEILLEEDLFERWTESPPFPPQAFKDALLKRFKLSILELQSFGEKCPRVKVRKILKSLVNDITVLDEKFDFVIETEEREDIYNAFDDLTFLSKQRVLIDEIPDWHYLKW